MTDPFSTRIAAVCGGCAGRPDLRGVVARAGGLSHHHHHHQEERLDRKLAKIGRRAARLELEATVEDWDEYYRDVYEQKKSG
jgi:hypothetical protein